MTKKLLTIYVVACIQMTLYSAVALIAPAQSGPCVIDLSDGRIHEEEIMDTLKEHPERVTGIDLSNNGITNLPEKWLGEFINLTTLILRGNPLTIFSESTFASLSRLKVLDVSDCELDDHFFTGKWMRTLPLLRVLNASNNLLTQVPDFSAFRQLQTLDLSHNAITRCTSERSTEGPLEQLQKLRVLFLDHNEIQEFDETWLPVIPAESDAGVQLVVLDNNDIETISPLTLLRLSSHSGTSLSALNNPRLRRIEGSPLFIQQRSENDDEELLSIWSFNKEDAEDATTVEKCITKNSATQLAQYMIKRGVKNTQECYFPWLLEDRPTADLEVGGLRTTPIITLRRNKVKVALGAIGAVAGGAAAVAYGPAALVKIGFIKSVEALSPTHMLGIGASGCAFGGAAMAGIGQACSSLLTDIEQLCPESDIIEYDGHYYVLKKNVQEYRGYAQTTILLSRIRIYLATLGVLLSTAFSDHYTTEEEQEIRVRLFLSPLCLTREESATIAYILNKQSEPEFIDTMRKFLPADIAQSMRNQAPEGTYASATDVSLSSMKMHAKDQSIFHTITAEQVTALYEKLQNMQPFIRLLRATITNRYYGNNVSINRARIAAGSEAHADTWSAVSTLCEDMRAASTESGISAAKSITDIFSTTSTAAYNLAQTLRAIARG